ncbi:hypothetical protein ACD591_09930 [Rufibacter glacialis]|uniref:Tissue inhibitor of metalloproteinase n=1 Tax=Rufibacter glacialis TaxID=1259555 RepID=A0A5M8QA16_9BACT|nr:hypothetical protein [Rufibacter glacialis]KAA6431911.1 hypothetical protein FOE74_17540 [Rufibacter glacialis]GGK80494.1 hypothetical protein GCM10011405_30320 [Rufibacter glacialis]
MKLTFTVLSLFLLTAHVAVACSCMNPPSVEENWRAAGQVFIGQVERVDTSSHFYSSSGGRVTLFTVRVLESFKQEVYEGYPLRSFVSNGGAACDSYFRVGEKYLIYAYADSQWGMLRSSLCDRTGLLGHTEVSELEQLRKLMQEAKGTEYVSLGGAAEYELSLLRASNGRLEEELRWGRIILATLVGGFVLIMLIQWRRRKP